VNVVQDASDTHQNKGLFLLARVGESATERNTGSVAQREYTVSDFHSTGEASRHTGQGVVGITGQDILPFVT